MSRSLGSLTLHNGVQWVNGYNWSPVRMNAERTTSGRLVVQTQQITKGQPIELVYPDGLAVLSASEKDTLRSMAASAGATYTLTWGADVYTVMFDHRNADALSFQPMWGFVYHDQPEQTQFFAQIKLLTI